MQRGCLLDLRSLGCLRAFGAVPHAFPSAPLAAAPHAAPRGPSRQLTEGCYRKQRAAGHSAARRGLDMRLRRGDAEASGVSSRQGLGTALLGKAGDGFHAAG